MSSRVVAFFISLMLLATSVMACAPAGAAPDQQPLAVVVAADQAGDEQPAGPSTSHDQVETLIDIPDQLAGPSAIRDAALPAYRIEPHLAVNPPHPHLEGPQRPPRATGLTA